MRHLHPVNKKSPCFEVALFAVLFLFGIDTLSAQQANPTVLNAPVLSNTTIVQDYDGDGDLDIIATQRDPDRLIWLENEPTRQFPIRVIVDTDLTRPADVDAADMDGDGDLDYVVCSQSDVGGNNPGELVWFERQSDDTYIKRSIDVGKDFDKADLADFNGDGLIDIVAVGFDQTELNIYLNNGDMNFELKTIATEVVQLDVVDADDVDGDGDIDIAFKGNLYLNDGSAEFELGYPLYGWSDGSPFAGDGRLLIVDLNNDGIKDILTFDLLGTGGLYFLDGANSFDQVLIDREGIDIGGSFEVADFDDNGLLDIARQHARTGNISVMYQMASMQFSKQTIDPSWSGTNVGSQMVVADIDADGDLDLVVPNNSTILTDHDLAWYENIDGQLYHHYLYADLVRSNIPKLADFDQDGDLDLFLTVAGHAVSSKLPDNEVILFENMDGENFINWRLNGAIPVDDPADIELGDADNDGDLDAFVTARGANDLLLFKNNSFQPNWQRDTIDLNANEPVGLALADLDGDGDLDAVLCSSGDAKVYWYQNDGSAVFTRRIVDSDLTAPIEVEVADLNGDEVNDVVVISSDATHAVTTYLTNANNDFDKAVVYTGKSARDIEVGDWDGDDDLDLLVSFFDEENAIPEDPIDVLLLTNDGEGNFTPTGLRSGSEKANAIKLYDMDADGDLDLLMSSDNYSFNESSLIHLAINTDGQITDFIKLSGFELGTVKGIAVGDTDGDDIAEVIYADYSRDRVVLLNDVPLKSEVTEPGISPESLDFGLTGLQRTSELTFTITNTSDYASLEVTNIMTPDGFSVSGTVFSITKKASQEVTVTFEPQEEQVYAGQIVVISNAGETALDVTGEGAIITDLDMTSVYSEDFKIFPNPTNSLLQVQLPAYFDNRGASAQLIDKNGRVYLKSDLSETGREFELDLRSIPAGIIFLRIENTAYSIVKKLIVLE